MKKQIRAAFQERIHILPREVSPAAYQMLLDEMGITTRPEMELLSEIVKEEVQSVQLAVTRAKFNHFLWWLGGQQ